MPVHEVCHAAATLQVWSCSQKISGLLAPDVRHRLEETVEGPLSVAEKERVSRA